MLAFRSDSQDHARYKDWLEGVINGAHAYGISPQVLCAVVRISTHHRIYARPSPRAEALGFCRLLLEQPNATLIQPAGRHWQIFEAQCRVAQTNGNLVQDAWYAALAIESGCEWITTDRDYARFPDLLWRSPF